MSAGPGEPTDLAHAYLVEQANLRGFLGAWSASPVSGRIDPELDVEAIVAGLLQPHAPAEVRILKLVLRILQSGRHDPARLVLACRRERALDTLCWLLEQIPETERTEPVRVLETVVRAAPPRAPRPPRIRFDPRRLERRRLARP